MNALQAQDALEKLENRILSNDSYLKVNKDYVEDYVEHLKAKGTNLKTIHKHLYSVEVLFDAVGTKIDLKQVTKKDIERVVAKVEATKRENGSDYTEEHRVRTRTIIKAFYKHLLGDDEFYPKQVAWIKTTGKRSERVLPQDILTEDEVLRLVDTAINQRDKAMISLLFDAGIRMGELLNMKKKDVDLDSNPAHITVKGKTGARQVTILFSVPYLASYMNIIKNKKAEDLLWKEMGVWINENNELQYDAVRKMLKTIAIKAGITKRIYPHLFRHSRATYYANRLTEQQLKHYFGWTGDSKMASTYVHLSGRDIDNAILEANGLKPQEEVKKPKLKIQTCPKCRLANGVDMLYCGRCGSALDIKAAIEQENVKTDIKQAMKEALKDPNVVEDIVHIYLMEQRNRMKK